MKSLITVEELREEIGAPTRDSAEAGYVADKHLGPIIERAEEAIDDMVAQRLAQYAAESRQPIDDSKFETVQVNLDRVRGMAEGEIPETYYPFTFHPATSEQGRVFEYDRNAESINQSTLFEKRRFRIKGDKVRATPETTSVLYLTVAPKDVLRAAVAADIIPDLNQQIIQQARQMLQARIEEGIRQETDNETWLRSRTQ